MTAFLDYCRRASETYATDNLLVTMGGDFTYMDANLWYKNMDKLIKYASIDLLIQKKNYSWVSSSFDFHLLIELHNSLENINQVD